MIAAGVLHDTIEKTDADAADVQARFGVTIGRSCSPSAMITVSSATHNARQRYASRSQALSARR